jgi:hypothetical protein
VSWGLFLEYEVYDDTQKSTALDEHRAARGELDPAPGPRAVTAA